MAVAKYFVAVVSDLFANNNKLKVNRLRCVAETQSNSKVKLFELNYETQYRGQMENSIPMFVAYIVKQRDPKFGSLKTLL